MAGDPLHDAFLAHLGTELDECGLALPWSVIDTRNTTARPDASRPYVDFEILPASADQFTTGSPGDNLHRETGQITISFKIPVGDTTNQNAAGSYANLLLRRFLYPGTRFDCDDRTVRLFSPLRMGFGEDDGGMWIETMAVSYEQYLAG